MTDVLAEAQALILRRESLMSGLREEETRLIQRIAEVRAALVQLALGDNAVAGYSRTPGLERSEEAARGTRPTRRNNERQRRRASIAMEDSVLKALRQQGPLTSAQLRSGMQLGQTTVSRATRELLRRGLIRALVVRSRGAPLRFEAVDSPSSSMGSASETRTVQATVGASTGGPP